MIIIMLAYTSASRFITLVNRGSMLTFFVFLILFFNHVDWIQELKNREKDLIISLVTGIIVIINMFLSKAGPGVIFDIANLLLLLYLADRIELDDISLWIITVSFLFIFLFWIKADGSSYNANTITIIVFESTIISALGGSAILSKWKKEWIACIYLIVAMLTVTWPIAKKFWGRTTLVAILIMLSFLFLMCIRDSLLGMHKTGSKLSGKNADFRRTGTCMVAIFRGLVKRTLDRDRKRFFREDS